VQAIDPLEILGRDSSLRDHGLTVEGLFSVMSADTPGGVLLRGFLPAIFLLPALGVVSVWAHERGLFSVRLSVALLVLVHVLLLSAIAVVVATSMHQVDLQRRRVATDLAHSEQELSITLQSIGDAVISTDAEGTVMRMNTVAERLTGWSLADAKKEPFDNVFRIVDEASGASVGSPVGRVLENGKVDGLPGPTLLVSRDGTRRPILDSAAPIREAQGPLRGAVLVFRDATRERTAERSLSASEARKTAILDSTFDAIVSMGEDHVIVEFNAAGEKLFGYGREEAVGKSMAELLVPSLREAGSSPAMTCVESGIGWVFGQVVELPARRADGSEFLAEVAIARVAHHEPRLFTASLRDVTERRRAEDQAKKSTADLKASLKEREVLLREVHHRVKNNLQVISSLLNMQVRQVPDRSTRGALEACQTRVQAIALIHEKLYQSEDFAHVPFSDYAKSLTESILYAGGVAADTLSVELHVEPIYLTVERAIPCGLILNELVTNALKHAFPDGRPGVIRVGFHRISKREIALSVTDDGVGLPQSFSVEKSNSLGMKLVSTLVEQLKGRLEITGPGGTAFMVTFPEVN